MEKKVFVNTFKQSLRKQEKVIGCWSALGSPVTAEVLGLAGFDWILLDGEHAPNDVLTFMPQLMALKDSPSAVVVRPPENNPTVIKRLLDIGFYNFIVPYVETAEEAALAVASTKYPPEGIRGVSVAHRNNAYGTYEDYFMTINDNISVVVQIESAKGVDNIESILDIEALDGVFVGPSDLAAALGHIGNAGHPDVQSAIKTIFDKALEKGKTVGILAPVNDDAERYIEWGANLVAVGSDLGVLKAATAQLSKKFK